jgi:hypothetical protein
MLHATPTLEPLTIAAPAVAAAAVTRRYCDG